MKSHFLPALLAFLLCAAGAAAPAGAAPQGRLLLEYWENVPGSAVADLTAHTRFPDKPTGRDFPQRFESLANWGDNLGTRLRGYVHAPTSGAYTFWIAGDDTAELWLSTDENLANKKRIALVPGATGPREWTKHASQRSALINLTGGEHYYIEVLHKNGGGGDQVAVGWQLPGGALERPIDGNRLSPFVLATSVPAQADVLDRLSTGHPRLLASAQTFARVKQQIAADPAVAAIYQRTVSKANGFLAAPVSTYVDEGTTGILEVSRDVLERVQTLAFVYRIGGDARYAERAWKELEAAKNFPNWCPRHFLDTAEMTHGFAIGYDWLYDYWTPARRTLLREAIVSKGLVPAQLQYNGGGWWRHRGNTNWNAVCNGGIGMGALALGDEATVAPLAQELLHKGMVSLRDYGVRPYAPDGGYAEGPGYWSYGTKYLITFFAASETAQGADFGLSDAPGLAETGNFPLYMLSPVGKSFNFGDGGDGATRNPSLFWLSRRYGQPLLAWYMRQGSPSQPTDLLWYSGQGASPEAIGSPHDKFFRGEEVAVFRSGWNKNALFLGFKAGGNNNGHDHLDIGAFVLDALGQRWADELGWDKYSLPGYFGEHRWKYYRCRAEGQNTLVVNPTSAPEQNLTAQSKMTRYVSSGQNGFAIADLSPAYTGHGRPVIKRGVLLLNNRTQVLVQDEIQASTSSDVWWFMHTRAAVQVASGGKSALLTLGTKRLWARIVSGPAAAVFSVRDARPLPTSPDPAGQSTNSGVRKLSVFLDNVTNARLAILLAPLDEGQNPPTSLPVVTALTDWSAPTTPPPANKAPSVTLTGPANGATFTAPADITLSANASDPDGTVAKVEFFHGSSKLGEDTSAPYTYAWNNVPAGSYSLRAKAIDNDGASATSAPVTVTVNAPSPANKAPAVSLTSPTNGATFTAPASIALAAMASDSDGTIAKIEFFHGAAKLGEDTTSPYTTPWNNVAAGTYSLSAKATDNDGAQTTSVAVTVTVKAALPAPDPTPALVNLALGKNATQSSTPAGTTGGANTAALAIDNNPDGNWAHGSVTHTNLDKEAWWQVDLGAIRAITTVEIFNRTDGASGRLSDFHVLVSDTPFTSTGLQATLAQAGVWHFRHNATAGSPTSISVHRMGRYVRVQLAGTSYLSLAEVKVMGYASALPNLALNKSATQSSRPQGTPAPSAAVDGNPNGAWSSNSVTHTGLDNRPWWQVDLGASQDITTINLFNRTDNSQQRLSNVHVFVSDQPFPSTDLTTTLKQPGVWHGYVTGTVGTPTSVPVHRSGRFVRMQLGDTNYLSLAEVQVLGFPDSSPDTNLALGKSATQSSRPQGTPAPNAAVDNNTSGLWSGGSITHTNLDKEAWWQVDLGQSQSLTHVELFNRTDNATERLGNVFVLVSDAPFVSGNLQTTLQQPGVTATHLPTQAGAPTSVPVHRTGRFVRVQLAGTGYLSLAEVKVMGLPITNQAAAAVAALATTRNNPATTPQSEPNNTAQTSANRAQRPQSNQRDSSAATPSTATASPAQTTAAQPTPTRGRGTGLIGEYFDDKEGTRLVTVRLDPVVDFSWGRDIPKGTAITHPDTWGVRWSGWVEAPVSGTYTFTTTSDDGIRLWVNGKRLIDDWAGHAPKDNHGTINLTAGRRYRLVIEYYESVRSATAKLWWAYPGQAKQILPAKQLYPSR